jgi:hypothetical protein
MRTVRRVYLYLVAFISLEVVIWGAVYLGRSIIACSGYALCRGADILALGLASVLVGGPFFLVHWLLAQRFALREEEERTSSIRAVFLYGVLLATLIPIVQNLLAFLDHLVLKMVGQPSSRAMFSSGQTWSDNLVAILINAVFTAYFFNLLRKEWRSAGPVEAFSSTRRLYRYIWLTYSLVILVAAIDQLLRFILDSASTALNLSYRAAGAHGIALAVVGVPLWTFLGRLIGSSLDDPVERGSGLRLGVLYFYSLAGVVTVLSAGGVVVDVFLRLLLGESMNAGVLLSRISGPLSIAVPLGLLWAYYGRQLSRAIAGAGDAPRRAGMRRVYAYILSAIGLGATFTGLALLLTFIVDAAIGNIVWAGVLRPRLAAALATLLVGLPLWWLAWRPMQVEALAAGDAGDHARRSIIRKAYLYLALFAGVIGGMVVAVGLVNMLLRSLFGSAVTNLLRQSLKDLEMLCLFAGLGTYHGLLLRRDGRLAAAALAEKHAAFPVLVFESGDGSFSGAMLAALQKQAPRLPVTVQPAAGSVNAETAPAAVVLPSGLAVASPEPLRLWLVDYQGKRVVVPLADSDRSRSLDSTWLFAGGVRQLPQAAASAAQVIRQLAEGQEIRQEIKTSGWTVVVYIAAAFLGLELLGALLSLGISLFSR